MHTGLKSEFSQQSLISKCLLNSVTLWNEIILFGAKANWISHDALPGRKLCQGTDGAERLVNNLPSALQSRNCIEELSLCIYCVQRCNCLSQRAFLRKALPRLECYRPSLEVGFWRVKERSRCRIVNSTFILKLYTKATSDGTQCVEHTLWNDVQVWLWFCQLSVKWQHKHYNYGPCIA